jgi:hypothetical protein
MGLEEMVSFFDYARDNGIMPPNAVHNWSGAISAISHCLNGPERTVEFVQGNLEMLRGRLTRNKPELDPRTVNAYTQRAATAISHFLCWKEDPTKWEKTVAAKPPRRGKRRQAKKFQAPEKPIPPSLISHLEEVDRRSIVRIPLESGQEFKLEFSDSFAMSDVWRVVWALAVHARDFDPERLLKQIGKPPSSHEGTDKNKFLAVSSSA